MPRLINRQKFVPNGFKFYDPSLKWTAPVNASFQVICDGLRAARLANPGVSRAKGLSTDPAQIAEEVDFFNATICEQNGWTDFITGGQGGAQAPFFQGRPRPGLLDRARNVAAGSEVLVDWLASGADAVPPEQANARAHVCAVCPLNERGGWERFFTVPVSDAIRRQVGRKQEMKLETPHDDKLGVCSSCDCPMALKVWMKLDAFLPKMSQQAKDSLHENCWIRKEESALPHA